MPLNEGSETSDKTSPYAKSKLAMEKAVLGYRSHGLDVIVARPFNHIGPGQGPGFLLPDLAAQLMAGSVVQVGDLSTSRDYTDVRDVVRAYLDLATTKKLSSDIYNICSGKPIKGSKILTMLATEMKKGQYKTVVDRARIRPDDPNKIFGSYELIKKDTGWKPTIKLEQTIADFVNSL